MGTTSIGNQPATLAEKAVNTALHSLKIPPLCKFLGGRVVKSISALIVEGRRGFRVTFFSPSGPMDTRLIIVGTRDPKTPPISEVLYIQIEQKVVKKRDKVRRKVIEAIESSF